MFKKVAFTMYPVKDWQRARAFYEQTLGLSPRSKSSNGHRSLLVMMNINNHNWS